MLWNVLLARHYRTGAWDYAGPVAFEDMGRSVVGQIDRAVGSPFSLPASLFEWWRTGRSPADYESLFMLRRYGRWTIRMGDDDRIFLEDGWSGAAGCGRHAGPRLTAGSSGLVAPLHGDRAYRLGARVRLEGAELGRLRVLMNDKVLGSWDLTRRVRRLRGRGSGRDRASGPQRAPVPAPRRGPLGRGDCSRRSVG